MPAKVWARTYAISVFSLFALHFCLDAPKETKVISMSSDVKKGEKVTISCSSKAKPQPSYKWFKPDKSLFWTEQTLILNTVQLGNKGMFYCQAENIHGHEDSPVITINVICKYSMRVTESICVGNLARIKKIHYKCKLKINTSTPLTFIAINWLFF